MIDNCLIEVREAELQLVQKVGTYRSRHECGKKSLKLCSTLHICKYVIKLNFIMLGFVATEKSALFWDFMQGGNVVFFYECTGV